VFATKTVNSAGADGWFYGDPAFFFTQLKGAAIVVVYSFTVSYVIFKLLNLIQPIRVSQEEEELGLDESQHNEKYVQGTLLVTENGVVVEKEIKLLEKELYEE
ncbi:MAG TPA: ammonia channel protein, partial [Sphingobacteriaceae bacterium]